MRVQRLHGCARLHQLHKWPIPLLDQAGPKNCTCRGQGGHGPGWQSRTQSWPQSGISRRPQVPPQVCGRIQGSQGGSATASHMQRYSCGVSLAKFSSRHLGHAHTAGSGSPAGRCVGPCDLCHRTATGRHNSQCACMPDPCQRMTSGFPCWLSLLCNSSSALTLLDIHILDHTGKGSM